MALKGQRRDFSVWQLRRLEEIHFIEPIRVLLLLVGLPLVVLLCFHQTIDFFEHAIMVLLLAQKDLLVGVHRELGVVHALLALVLRVVLGHSGGLLLEERGLDHVVLLRELLLLVGERLLPLHLLRLALPKRNTSHLLLLTRHLLLQLHPILRLEVCLWLGWLLWLLRGLTLVLKVVALLLG